MLMWCLWVKRDGVGKLRTDDLVVSQNPNSSLFLARAEYIFSDRDSNWAQLGLR